MRQRLSDRYANGGNGATAEDAPAEAPPPGQTALFNAFEDAVECAKWTGRMI